MKTSSGGPGLPKPNALIGIRQIDGPSLALVARKVFNFLLASYWDELEDPGYPGPLRCSALSVRRGIGQRTEQKNARLDVALHQLSTARFLIGSPEPGQPPVVSSLIRDGHIDSRRNVTWDFPPVVRSHIAHAQPWATLDMSVANRFRSKYGLILYEHLSMYRRRKFKTWEATVQDLRSLLGTSDRLVGWWAIEHRALKPALAEIKELAKFDVEMKTTLDVRSRSISKVKFTVGTRSPKPQATKPRQEPLGRAI